MKHGASLRHLLDLGLRFTSVGNQLNRGFRQSDIGALDLLSFRNYNSVSGTGSAVNATPFRVGDC